MVLRRDEPLVHVSVDISLITEHILDHDESMVSLVLRQYMRGENVLLIQIGKQNVKIIVK